MLVAAPVYSERMHVHLYDLSVAGNDPDFVTTWTCRCGLALVKAGLPTSLEGSGATVTIAAVTLTEADS